MEYCNSDHLKPSLMSRDIRLKAQDSRKLKKLKPEYEKLYIQFYPALCYFARRLIRNNDGSVAEDIVTEVFIKYWEIQFQFETVYKVKAFLYISTRNACLNYNQKVACQLGILEKIQEIGDFAWLSLNELTYKIVLDLVFDLINELPEKCKEVILMIFVQGKNNGEVAKQMNISIHTVRNQKRRGIQLIKKSRIFEKIKYMHDSRFEQSLGMSSKLYTSA